MGKSVFIYRLSGAINVTFESLWDQKTPFLNVGDFVPLMFSATAFDGGRYDITEDGFEIVSHTEQDETWKLAGIMEERNTSTNVLTIGLYAIDPNDNIIFGPYMAFNGTEVYKFEFWTNPRTAIYDGLSVFDRRDLPLNIGIDGGSNNEFHFSCNIPIFKSNAALDNYIRTGEIEDCWNIAEYDFDETEYYWIYNRQQNGKLYNGKITPVSDVSTWHSLKFSANQKPVLYFDDDFEIVLKAPSIVASKAIIGPGYILDEIPEEAWTEGILEYSGPFYGTLAAKIQYTGTLPANGNYMFGADVNTNIPIFKTQSEADYAIASGDYSAAGNYYNIEDGNTHQPIEIGDAEAATTFGSGYGTSPFVSSYIMTKNNVLNVANAFYSNDTTLIDNIKKGLELFGANPYDAVCGLSWFPFDLNTVANAISQNYIYFGSYQYTGVTADKITNLKSSGYVNAGSVYIAPLFESYRDFEPYCQLSVYLPYSGWHELDIAKYYKKTVNIRYYIDIYTNTFACAITIDNQICDIFNGNIGVNLPISGTNMSEYGNSMLRAVLGTVGSTAGGALSGAMLGGGVPGAVIGATVGGFAGIAKGTFEMAQKGQPKDHLQVKGAFSGASSSYMPQYVIFRYDVHDLIVPDNLTNLYGRPSSASGKVGSFSGYLKCDTVKLNTGRMTDAEINETLSLLRQGIFV